jgi:hypothetical protein
MSALSGCVSLGWDGENMSVVFRCADARIGWRAGASLQIPDTKFTHRFFADDAEASQRNEREEDMQFH